MASLLTVDDVLRGVLGEDGDSDGDFDGYTSGRDDSEANGGGDGDLGDSSNGGNEARGRQWQQRYPPIPISEGVYH